LDNLKIKKSGLELEMVFLSMIEEKSTSANTDNKGKLFVTVFAFAPATKTDLFWWTNPDPNFASLRRARHAITTHKTCNR
jgi:hypothetical protein